jgi:hypothetical protein
MGSTKMLDSGRAFHGSKYSTSFSGFNQNKPCVDYFNLLVMTQAIQMLPQQHYQD